MRKHGCAIVWAFALMEVNNPHMVYTQLKLAYILKTGGFMNTYSTQ